MTVDVGNIELSLAQKTSSGASGIDLLTAHKILGQLKTGEVHTVGTFASLPTASENIGKLYYVSDEDIVYWANASLGWVNLNTVQANSIFTVGEGSYGQIGNSSFSDVSSPTQEACLASNWSQVSVGTCHVVGLKQDNTIWQWGNGIFAGMFTFGTNRNLPCGPAPQCVTWCFVNSGKCRNVALGTDGSLWMWGWAGGGSLAQNNSTNYYSAVQEITSSTWIQASTGWYQTSQGIKSDGTFWSWGADNYGMHGKNTCNVNASSPVQEITSSTNWCTGDVGFYNNGGIKTDGTLWGWGVGFYGANLAVPNASVSSPVQENGSATNWCKMAWTTGNQPYSGLALKTDGTLWGWGCNGNGTLADGAKNNTSTPVQEISSSTTWCGVAAGSESGRGIKTDGTVWAWGKQFTWEFAQLNQNTCYSSPVQEYTSGTNWGEVSAGGDYNNGITSIMQSVSL